MKMTRFTALSLAVLTTITLSGCNLFPKEEETLAPPLVAPSTANYKTVAVKRGSIIDSITVTGSFVSTSSYDLTFEERSGYLEEVRVKAGDSVKKGDVIARLDTGSLESEIGQQKLRVERAQIALEAAQREEETVAATVRKAQIDYELQMIALSQQEMQRDNWEILTQIDKDALEVEIKRQKLVVEKAKIAVDEALAAANRIPDSVRLAQIDYDSAKLTLDEQESELAKLVIYAPADGVVSYLSDKKIGEYIQARETFACVVDPNLLQVECIDDRLRDLAIGQEVTVTSNKDTLHGKIVMTLSTAPKDFNKAGPFIRVEITDALPAANLQGRGAVVEIVNEQKDNVLLLPQSTVSEYLNEKYVLVLENGIKKERPVETGIKDLRNVEIISGLEEGEEVIYS